MLVIGSRGSKLALWQANWVKAQLAGHGLDCRIEVITTSGDRFQQGPLKEIGNKGLFTKEIEEALLQGAVDLAVHSLKDMPAQNPEGLTIAATPPREDPRDALVGARLEQLAPGARVGTGSLRRIAQLRSVRPDLLVEPMRGNVDTRLRKLDEGQYQAIVLASAGLNRLGWADRIAEHLDVAWMCPAVGQGALAIQTRADRGGAWLACQKLDHQPTRTAVDAERALLESLGGGCQIPVGAHASFGENGDLLLQGVVASPDGGRVLRDRVTGSPRDARELGLKLGSRLRSAGAEEILAPIYGAMPAAHDRP